MNAPYYTLAIDIVIRGLKDSDDIWMRCNKIVPFIPMNGVTIELWHDDSELEEQTYRITLQNTYYSFEHSLFIEEQVDEDLMEAARAGEPIFAARDELINWYKAFGFVRMNYPQAQAIR